MNREQLEALWERKISRTTKRNSTHNLGILDATANGAVFAFCLSIQSRLGILEHGKSFHSLTELLLGMTIQVDEKAVPLLRVLEIPLNLLETRFCMLPLMTKFVALIGKKGKLVLDGVVCRNGAAETFVLSLLLLLLTVFVLLAMIANPERWVWCWWDDPSREVHCDKIRLRVENKRHSKEW